jgi:hypothetical protein
MKFKELFNILKNVDEYELFLPNAEEPEYLYVPHFEEDFADFTVESVEVITGDTSMWIRCKVKLGD